jgi:hypothetical protein
MSSYTSPVYRSLLENTIVAIGARRIAAELASSS